MRIVCGYIWGIWWWRTSAPDTRVADHLCGTSSLDGCRDGMGLLRAAGLEGLREKGRARGIPQDIPVDLITNERSGHAPSALCVRHYGRGDLPSGSLCSVAQGIYVFTPEICLLQVASSVTKRFSKSIDPKFCLVIIAELASELCSQYSLSAGDALVKRKPLLELGTLFLTAESRRGAYGVNLLRAALPFVVEKARSPKEVDIFLLLCLPSPLGGFALPRPLSNYDIDVRQVREGFFAGWTVCNVDFFWGQAKLVVEYDSRAFHDDLGVDKTAHDIARAEALRELGYTVVTIRRDDLYSPPRFREKASEIASALGVGLPSADKEFLKANETLRMMLLRHDRWV